MRTLPFTMVHVHSMSIQFAVMQCLGGMLTTMLAKTVASGETWDQELVYSAIAILWSSNVAYFSAPLSASDAGVDKKKTPAKQRGAHPQGPHSAQP